MMKIIKGLLFGLLLPFLAWSQAPTLSLEQAISRAMEANLNIRIEQSELALAQKANNLGNAGYLPVLNADGSVQQSTINFSQELANNPELITVDGAQSSNLAAGLRLSYTLFNGMGRLYNLQQLRMQEQLSDAQLRFTIENELLSVLSTYYQLTQLQAQEKVALQAVALSENRYQRARIAAEVSGASELEVLATRVDLNNDSAAYLQVRQQYELARRDLNVLLQYPTDTVYRTDSSIIVNEQWQLAELQAQAAQNSSALLQADINKQLQEKRVQQAWSQYLPNLNAFAGYDYSRQENEASFLRFTQSNGLSYGITATWNLFNSARTKTEIEQASIRVFQSELQYEQAEMQLETDLAKSYLIYQNALDLLRLQKRNVNTAERNFARSQAAYDLGQITRIALREAQLNLVRARLEIINLRYSAKLAELDMQRIAGLLMQ